jgi:malonyl-CoA O-methyltransferase
VSVLPAREAYRLWAAKYEAETAVSHLENRVVEGLGVRVTNCRLLDVGCGTARRLHDTDASFAVGVDLSVDMLRAALEARLLAAADVRALPFASESFDVVWCRLMIGHVRDFELAYAELARVCRARGTLIVSDLCTEAVAAGHRRTFRDANGVVQEVEHFVHTLEAQARAALDAGLELEVQRDAIVGPEIREFYSDAGRIDLYEKQRGLPLVRVLLLRKMAA